MSRYPPPVIPLLSLVGLARSQELHPGGASSAAGLEGSWRFDVVVLTRAEVPVLGASLVETHKVMLARIERDGRGAYTQSQTVCGLFARSRRKAAEPVFPAGFLRAMPDQSSPLRFDAEEGRLRVEVEPVRLGWDPRQSGGSMPREAGDAGITDADGDGQPGVTLMVQAPLIGQVSLYVVQHSQTWLDGAFEGPDRVRGRAGLSLLEQRTIGASNPLFRTNVPLKPVSDGGWFQLSRVPEGTSCAELDAAAPPPAGSPAADRAAGVRAG